MRNPVTSTVKNISSTYCPHYLEDLLGCNYTDCETTIQQLLKWEVDLKEMATGFFQHSLYDVGRLFKCPRVGRKAMIACGAGVPIVRNLDALATHLLQYECRKVGE